MSRFEEVDNQYEAHEVEARVFDHWEAVDFGHRHSEIHRLTLNLTPP